jgi:elongation factor P hydroxylase
MMLVNTLANTNSTSASPANEQVLHDCHDLISIFNHTFLNTENTVLVKGGLEPIYIPAGKPRESHQIVFSHDYFASALHEIAHWCIAGIQRRLLEDYGYWYSPDGRNTEQQKQFESVEVKPQAIEWAFSCAANKRFLVSSDNLNAAPTNTLNFQRAVKAQALSYLELGFPARATLFLDALHLFYQSKPLYKGQFND